MNIVCMHAFYQTLSSSVHVGLIRRRVGSQKMENRNQQGNSA